MQLAGSHATAELPPCSNPDNNKGIGLLQASHPPTVYLQYLDANNLYGWAMCQHLPVSDFEWSAPSSELLADILKHPSDASNGYIVECDLSVPDHLHDLLNDYPPAPEKVSIGEHMLSPYQLDLLESTPITGLAAAKLVHHLLPKTRYVLHYRNLQLYVKLGLKIDNVHRVLSFNQSAWMKPYIELNTDLRKNAANDFERDFLKLMNNAVFDKTMENVRRRVNIRLLRVEDDEDVILTAVAKPTYAVLDLSKVLMYEFYYVHLKARYTDGRTVRFAIE